MTRALRCDGGLVGSVTAHSIDRLPVSQWQDVLRPSVNHLARRLERKCKLQRIGDVFCRQLAAEYSTSRPHGRASQVGTHQGGDGKGAGTVNRT
jgi:hypothetical protein